MKQNTKKAINLIKSNKCGERQFDSLFENGEDNSIQLIADLAKEARVNQGLKRAIWYNKEHMPISLFALAFPIDKDACRYVANVLQQFSK